MDKRILLPNPMEKDLSNVRKTASVVTYHSINTQNWEKEGPISWLPSPLQVKPHPEVGHPYLYTANESLHSLGYGVPALAMPERRNLPPMRSPNGPMGLKQPGEAGYVVLKQEKGNTAYPISDKNTYKEPARGSDKTYVGRGSKCNGMALGDIHVHKPPQGPYSGPRAVDVV